MTMYTTHVMQKIVIIGLWPMILLALITVGCNTIVGARYVEKYNQNPLTVVVPQNLSPAEVEQTIVQTLRGRQWVVVKQAPEEVVGQLDHQGWNAKVTFKVDGSLIKILNDSHFRAKADEERRPAIPKGWLENLQKDLNRRFGRTVSSG